MTVTDNISLSRIYKLLNQYFREQWKSYLLYSVSTFGVIILIITMNVLMNRNISFYYKDTSTLFFLGIILYGAIFGSNMFKNLSTKELASHTIMTPALHIEKFIARWIIYVPLFFICFTAFTYLADGLRFIFCEAMHEIFPDHFNDNQFRNILSTGPSGVPIYFSFIFALSVQSGFILGGLLWRKYAFQKTFAVCLCIIFTMATDFIGLSLLLNKYSIATTKESGEILLCTTLTIITLLMWILSYFRYKESEIINRW